MQRGVSTKEEKMFRFSASPFTSVGCALRLLCVLVGSGLALLLWLFGCCLFPVFLLECSVLRVCVAPFVDGWSGASERTVLAGKRQTDGHIKQSSNQAI
jgi:hypothetical protein